MIWKRVFNFENSRVPAGLSLASSTFRPKLIVCGGQLSSTTLFLSLVQTAHTDKSGLRSSQAGRLIEQSLSLTDPILRLLLIERLAVEGSRIESALDL
jgi:hypothetical protein